MKNEESSIGNEDSSIENEDFSVEPWWFAWRFAWQVNVYDDHWRYVFIYTSKTWWLSIEKRLFRTDEYVNMVAGSPYEHFNQRQCTPGEDCDDLMLKLIEFMLKLMEFMLTLMEFMLTLMELMLKLMEFMLKLMEFMLKLMESMLNMLHFILKMADYVLKLMHFIRGPRGMRWTTR